MPSTKSPFEQLHREHVDVVAAPARGPVVSRDAGQRIADILHAIDRRQRYLDALGGEGEVLVDMAEDAIERNLQIIGEAANHLPVDLTDAHPEIAWPQIRGFRNIVVHEYFGVDIDVVRDVVETHLPPLAEALEQHLADGK